jgi:hypothetical protein
MKSDDKQTAMFLIWAAFALACLFTFAGRELSAASVFMALFYVVGAMAATNFVMQAPVPEETPAKTKTHKVDRVLSSLTDEEIEQLRQRLSADDGEMVSLDDVMRGGKKQP